MQERFAVVFREGKVQAAGRFDVEPDRLLLYGRTADSELTLEIPSSDLKEVRIAHKASERLNGYRTILLERNSGPAVQVAPLGIAFVADIVSLLAALMP